VHFKHFYYIVSYHLDTEILQQSHLKIKGVFTHASVCD